MSSELLEKPLKKLVGDRPIEITLERAWNSLNWDEKLSLLSSVVRGITSHSDMSKKSLNDELEMVKNQVQMIAHLTSQLYEQLSFSYPSLLQPLIYERDTVAQRPTSATDASCNGWIVKLVQDLISHYYCYPLVRII
ncbi:hypothetical protein EV1_041508 [Malus domestica]